MAAIAFFAVVGRMFGKPVMTRTIGGEEPMVNLDAVALTQRIGQISHPTREPEPRLEFIAKAIETPQPKWRSYLRARTSP